MATWSPSSATTRHVDRENLQLNIEKKVKKKKKDYIEKKNLFECFKATFLSCLQDYGEFHVNLDKL